MRVVVTGATGFIGRHLMSRLGGEQIELVGVSRSADLQKDNERKIDITDPQQLRKNQDVFKNTDAVIMLTGLAHSKSNNLAEYNAVNVTANVNVMQVAAEMQVPKFVFVSSVKAVAETSLTDSRGALIRINEQTKPRPEGAYGISKLKAERELNNLARNVGAGLTIMRPPLVYGENQKGNLAIIFKLVELGIPLPFAGLDNLRSLISVSNLCEAIWLATKKNSLANQSYFVSDIDISTPDLIKEIAVALGRPANLINFSPSLLGALFKITGQGNRWEKLSSSLAIDNKDFCSRYGWTPRSDFRRVLRNISLVSGRS